MRFTFILDENLPPLTAKLLAVVDRHNEILALEDDFERGTPDIVWITRLATRRPKPIILSGDERILRNPAERVALKGASLHFICVSKSFRQVDWMTFSWKIVKVWPDVLKNVRSARRPTVFRLGVNKLERDCLISEL